MITRKMRAILACGIFSLACASQASASLIAHYTFDEASGTTVSDSVRPGGTGTIYKADNLVVDGDTNTYDSVSVTNGTFVQGVSGNGLKLDGSTYVIAPTAASTLTSYSVSGYVKFDSLTSFAMMVANWGAYNVGAYQFGLEYTGNKLYAAAGFSDGSYATLEDSAAVTTDKWYLLTTTYDGITQKLYVGDTLVGSNSVAGQTLSAALPDFMSFGVKLTDWYDGPSYTYPGWLKGTLDEIRFYDTALTTTEIAGFASLADAANGPAAVPEPSTYALLCISLGVVGYARRKMVKSEG